MHVGRGDAALCAYFFCAEYLANASEAKRELSTSHAKVLSKNKRKRSSSLAALPAQST